MLGQFSVTVAEACTSLTPVAFPVAVFVKPFAAQLVPAVVVAVMIATIVPFFARSFGPQVSVPAVIAHDASLPAPSEYDTPVTTGSGSLMFAPTAVPSPLFVSVTVHEKDSPAFLVCDAGVFVIPMLGQLSTVVAEACTSLTPVALPVAVFVIPLALQLVPAVVVALMMATIVPFTARSFGPHVSVPDAIAHVASLPEPSE
jgi:hypothetical protein